ncbi:unnamed protein product [Cylicocyclus nassatus]|uniref:MATH domain-containing protein n=1 Tax=Cylicocyclus nassatus TaxID=53992 RepID=A0AA36GNR3_CYLNA|nr:unnamed protein product [Cylicocyclus nassatus]
MTGPEFLANLPEGISACPFLEHGCHKVGSELDVKVHIRDDRIFHLVLLCRAVLDLKAAQLKTLREQPQKIMRTEEQLTPAYTVLKKYGPQCIFHIPQIHNVISDARKSGQNLVVSQPFETHRFGYKMTLLVAPYGDAEVSRQYISIFATIVKGDYDAIQCWPFKLPITFTLYAVDPNKNLERVFIPNPTAENDAFLGRPKGARNAAFGIQRFCALNDLDNYTIKGGLFIGAHVDLSGLHRARRMPSDEL